MKQFVLAITGPPGSGKSTVGEKLAKKLERCVNIDADHIKHMIVSGFYKDEKNPDRWSFNQWGLVGDSIGLLAVNFINEGYSVIINGYINEPAWTNIEKHVSITHKVLFLPEIETVVNRDAGRPEDIIMGEGSVRRHHKIFSAEEFYDSFTKLDTTDQTIDETVEAVIGMIN